jgi:hypothetical protein
MVTKKPTVGRPRKYETNADRVRAYRVRKDLVTFSVDLPSELVAEVEAWLSFKDMTKAALLEKLFRSQLLRKR